MGLTDIPFGKPSSLVEQRYALIERPGTAPADGQKDGDDYAAFIRDYRKGKTDDPYMSASKPQKTKKSDAASVAQLSVRLDKEKRQYEKRLRNIEDLMWQHKQKERELKRHEGGIIKDQRAVRQSVRQFEQAISRKQMSEDKNLDRSMQKYTKMQRSHQHTKESLTKERINKTQSADVAVKGKGRKFELDIARMQRDYRLKRDALDMRKIESDRIAREYEAKLRAKEEAQLRLKSELAELAIAMNVTAHKTQEFESEADKNKKQTTQKNIDTDLTNESELNGRMAKSTVDIKLSDTSRRKTNAELTLTKAHLAMKAREGGRQRQDVQTRLEDNRAAQRKLNDAAVDAEQDLRAKEIENKLQLTGAKRQALMDSYLTARQDREESTDALLRDRHQRRDQEARQRDMLDHLSHAQKSVRRGEEKEMELFNRVRNAEYQRQKQDAHVRELQRTLARTKRENAQRLKREMVDCERQERALLGGIVREQAQLAKVHNEREYSYNKLQDHRLTQADDRHLMEKREQEYQRLTRIGQRSNSTL